MNGTLDGVIDRSNVRSASGLDGNQLGEQISISDPRSEDALKVPPSESWDKRSERWGRLMAAGQRGDNSAYEQLLREIDHWLSRYYARRLPHAAAEDARQNVLLAIHAKRLTYAPSRAFGAWVLAIARYKWIDRIRDASRYAFLPLHDDIPIEDHEGTVISNATVDDLLGLLKPAQAKAIRLVKLKGLSVAHASGITGQSVALVKINIHRGLRKLATLVSSENLLAAADGSFDLV
jgi:RNA polymerase sigma factor (sigma-70 family)